MNLSWRDIACLFSFPCVMTVGQMLFKLTSRHSAGRPFTEAIGIFMAQPVFYAALCIYGLGTLLWLWLLSRYSLALAYPVAALALVMVPLLEVIFFGVRTNLNYWLGLAMIVGGVIVVTRAQAH